mgnify:CR=1 FL=1
MRHPGECNSDVRLNPAPVFSKFCQVAIGLLTGRLRVADEINSFQIIYPLRVSALKSRQANEYAELLRLWRYQYL